MIIVDAATAVIGMNVPRGPAVRNRHAGYRDSSTWSDVEHAAFGVAVGR